MTGLCVPCSRFARSAAPVPAGITTNPSERRWDHFKRLMTLQPRQEDGLDCLMCDTSTRHKLRNLWRWRVSDPEPTGNGCGANLAYVRPSRPDSGLGFQVNDFKASQVFFLSPPPGITTNPSASERRWKNFQRSMTFALKPRQVAGLDCLMCGSGSVHTGSRKI